MGDRQRSGVACGVGGGDHCSCDFDEESDGHIGIEEQSEKPVHPHALWMIRPERVRPHNHAAALLLLLLLKLLKLPVDSNSKLTVRQQHVHGYIGIPQTCIVAESVSGHSGACWMEGDVV